MDKLWRKCFIFFSVLLFLFNSSLALADCSGGPWYNVLLYNVPPHSATSCQYIVNSTSWMDKGCDAVHPGSTAINLGYCESAPPPYQYYAYGDCQCAPSKYPVCNSTDLVIDSAAQPPISCPLLCSTECSAMYMSGEGQCLGNQWAAYPCTQSGDQSLRCDCGAWSSWVPSYKK